MAYFDYLHCAVCESKVLYDADIDYEESNCGDIKVLCKECVKKNAIIIRSREEKLERKCDYDRARYSDYLGDFLNQEFDNIYSILNELRKRWE